MTRRIPWTTIAIGGAVLGAVGVATLISHSSKPAPPPSPRRVALIGDSYAVGLGPELARLFPNFKFEGHVGTNTWQWASHAAACGSCGDWITAFKPDIVLVSLGVNDVAPNLKNYQTIVSGLHGIGARVVWIEPPAGVKTSSIAAVRDVIASLGVPTVPATMTPLGSDNLHPRASYAEWAREIAHTLDDSIPLAVTRA